MQTHTQKKLGNTRARRVSWALCKSRRLLKTLNCHVLLSLVFSVFFHLARGQAGPRGSVLHNRLLCLVVSSALANAVAGYITHDTKPNRRHY